MNEITIKIELSATPELTEVLKGLVGVVKTQVPAVAPQEIPAQQTAPQMPITAYAPQTVPVTPQATAPQPMQNAPPAPVFPPATVSPVSPPVTSAPRYTKDQLGRAGSALVDAGKMQDVTDSLARFGVATLADLPEEHYGELATMFRQLGAQI